LAGQPFPKQTVAMKGESMGEIPTEDLQETPQAQDLRIGRGHHLDRPVADVLEQEMPVGEVEYVESGIDAERIEPLNDADWLVDERAEE
jgi:hypothetical protein